ncbi:YbeD family protein [Halarcobacter sp.]|uniref:HP0495 family protein n=1 Tax=Halarcobacter sp. TaxID=2321133 RepID=UPI003A8CCDFA
MIDLSKEKLQLDYPCSWKYKIVIHEKSNANKITEEIFIEREFSLEKSKVSKKGKFKSYSLELLVHNEDDRKEIYKMLGDHKDIKMVL